MELVHGGATHYVCADFPPESIQEVKWASVQRAHDHATTPETLLAAIPDAALASGVVLPKIPTLPGSWLYNDEALEGIPRLDWAMLYRDGAGLCPDHAAEAG